MPIRYKNIQVHEDTFEAFKRAIQNFKSHLPKEKMTHDKMLSFLLMDLEASLNAPLILRVAMIKNSLEYWLRREKKGDNIP